MILLSYESVELQYQLAKGDMCTLCNSGRVVMGVTNHSLIGPIHMEIHASYYELSELLIIGKVIGSK